MQNPPTIRNREVLRTDEPLNQVYDLHIQSLVQDICASSVFFACFSGVMFACSGWYLVDSDHISVPGAGFAAVLGISTSVCALLLGAVGLRTVCLRSWSSSLKYSRAMIVFYVLFMVHLLVFAAATTGLAYSEYGWFNFSWVILSYIVIGFLGCSMVLKSQQLHRLLFNKTQEFSRQQGRST